MRKEVERVSLEAVAKDRRIPIKDLRAAVSVRVSQVHTLLGVDAADYIKNQEGYSLPWLESFVLNKVDKLLRVAQEGVARVEEEKRKRSERLAMRFSKRVPKTGSLTWEREQRKAKLENEGYQALSEIAVILQKELKIKVSSAKIRKILGDLSKFKPKPHWNNRAGDSVYLAEPLMSDFKKELKSTEQ